MKLGIQPGIDGQIDSATGDNGREFMFFHYSSCPFLRSERGEVGRGIGFLFTCGGFSWGTSLILTSSPSHEVFITTDACPSAKSLQRSLNSSSILWSRCAW